MNDWKPSYGIAVKEQVQGTGTRSANNGIPASIFATAVYKGKNGRDVVLPLQVAADNITLQVDHTLTYLPGVAGPASETESGHPDSNYGHLGEVAPA